MKDILIAIIIITKILQLNNLMMEETKALKSENKTTNGLMGKFLLL